MDEDDPERTGKQNFLTKPRPCCCSSSVRDAAVSKGTTCQRVFEYALNRAGYDSSFARAVFIQYLLVPDGAKDVLVPNAVTEYSQRSEKMTGSKRRRKGFCIGCMIHPQASAAIAFAYSLSCPEVTRETLLDLAGQSKSHNPPKPTFVPMSEEDKLWRDLVESGALQEDDTDWERQMRGEDVL